MAERDAIERKSVTRRRPIMQAVWFSREEWERVQERMILARARSFGAFARACLVDGAITVREELDVSALRPELARIGNNVNQIARHANLEQAVSRAEVAEVRRMLSQLQASLDALGGRR